MVETDGHGPHGDRDSQAQQCWKGWRGSWCASQNIFPSSTSAAKAMDKVIPDLGCTDVEVVSTNSVSFKLLSMLPINFDWRDAVRSWVTLEGCCEQGTSDLVLVESCAG